MKKNILFLVSLVCVLGMTAACNTESSNSSSEKKEVEVTTSAPTSDSLSTSNIARTTTTKSTKKTTEKKSEPTTEKATKCNHNWQEANCTSPKICTVCGKTEGSVIDHKWQEANCTSPKTCTVCGKTEGSVIDHKWQEANCTSPKTCTVCGKTEGSAIGHKWQDANYEHPKTCIICGATEGDPLPKPKVSVNITTPLPKEFHNYNYKNNITDTINITDVTYSIEERYSGDYKLILYFTGEKTYDASGSGQSRTAKVSIKITDSDGYVVESGTFYSPSLKIGDKFRNEEKIIWDLKPGTYNIELLSTN